MRKGRRVFRILSPAAVAAAGVLCFAAVAGAETVVIEMTSVNFVPTFVPAEVTVQPGDTVQWVNVDPFLLDHSVCSGTGSFDASAGELWNSGTLRSQESFEFTFAETGEYAFFSVPHEYDGMFGVVIVTTSTSANSDIKEDTWGKVKNLFREVMPKK